MRRPLAVLLCALAMAGCVAHEKSGDSAAAVGDWKSAYGHYRQALADKPETPGLKEKHDRARQMALSDAWNRAQGCEQTQDWGCVLGETDYILGIEPNHPDAIASRSRAAVQQGHAQVALARTEVSQRQYREALDRLNAVRKLTADPGVNQRAASVQQELVSSASRDAEQRWYDRDYDGSLALYELLATIDPRYREQVRRVTEDRERAILARYEEQARRGDELLARYDFRGANQAYAAAEQLRAGGRAKPLIAYTQHLIGADDALKGGNYAACEHALRNAIATGQDRGLAAEMLDRVVVKPYRIAIRSVLLQPTRPGGDAWVGNTSGLFFRVAQQIDRALDRRQYDRAIDAAQNVPYENRPNLKVEALLPDGMVLQTSPRSGLYAAFDGEFVVAANQFDERRIVFRVFQERNNEEIGRVEAPLRDLLGAREVSLDSQTLAQVRVTVAKAQGRQPGTFINLVRIDTPAPGNTTGTATAGGAGPAVGPGQPPGGPRGQNPPGGDAVPASGTSGGQTAPAGSNSGGSVQPAGGTGMPQWGSGAATSGSSSTGSSPGGVSSGSTSGGTSAPAGSTGTVGSSGPGNSGNAPGHSGGSPGNSGNAPGQTGGTPGLGGGAPGNSGNAPGHGGTVGGGTPGNSGGGQGQGSSGSNDPGTPGGSPGNSGGNGGGNSGGNGGGNSGGNGGGNSGGNGGGNSGGGVGAGSSGTDGSPGNSEDDQDTDDKKKKKKKGLRVRSTAGEP